MIKPLIVPIAGKARHGKTTFANMLDCYLSGKGYHVSILGYADEVKKVAREHGWNGKKDHNGRAFLQFVGTQYGREQIDQDVWVEKLETKIIEKSNVADFILIDDVRFANEITYWRDDYAVYAIKVVREDESGDFYTAFDNELADHKSEKGVENKLADKICCAQDIAELKYLALDAGKIIAKKWGGDNNEAN